MNNEQQSSRSEDRRKSDRRGGSFSQPGRRQSNFNPSEDRGWGSMDDDYQSSQRNFGYGRQSDFEDEDDSRMFEDRDYGSRSFMNRQDDDQDERYGESNRFRSPERFNQGRWNSEAEQFRSERFGPEQYRASTYGSEGYGSEGFNPERSGNRNPMRWANNGDDHQRYFRSQGQNQQQQTQQRGEHVGHGPQSYKRSDDRIEDEVCGCLTRDGQVDARNIEVAVKDGVVTLTGTVSSKQAKRQAEDLCEEVMGVKDVENRLKVSSEQNQTASRSESTNARNESGRAEKKSDSKNESHMTKQ